VQPQIRKQSGRLSQEMQGLILSLILLATTLAVYAPVRQHPFIHIDDYGYVVKNFHIQTLNWDTVKWSFTTFHYSNWDPLTWLSHAIDWHFFGPDAGGHHEVSLLLHALSGLLLFWLLAQATGYLGRSFAVAAIFALHPVNVEPVAWVAERKTVLSMVFFLLTLIAYRWYTRHPAVHRYLVVALLFAMGLMSKPQVITLPFVLLLWDYWPLDRIAFRQKGALRFSPFAFRQKNASGISGEERIAKSEKPFLWLVMEKLPLLALSAGSALLTMKAQWVNGTLNGLNTYPFSVRLTGSIVGYVRYLGHAVWPTNLSFFYPHAHASPPWWQTLGAILLLLVITAGTLAARHHRYLAVGWLWFLGTLVPTIQLVQVGNHAMADRYAYVSCIGLFIAICWGLADFAGQWKISEVVLPVATVAVLAILMVATRRQLSYWTDDLALWRHAAEAVPDNAMAEEMIGETLLESGDSSDAITYFRTAEAMDPLFPFPHLHLGIYEENQHHPRQALAEFQKVIDLTQRAAAGMPAIRGSAFAHMSFSYAALGDFTNQQKYLAMAAQENAR